MPEKCLFKWCTHRVGSSTRHRCELNSSRRPWTASRVASPEPRTRVLKSCCEASRTSSAFLYPRLKNTGLGRGQGSHLIPHVASATWSSPEAAVVTAPFLLALALCSELRLCQCRQAVQVQEGLSPQLLPGNQGQAVTGLRPSQRLTSRRAASLCALERWPASWPGDNRG